MTELVNYAFFISNKGNQESKYPVKSHYGYSKSNQIHSITQSTPTKVAEKSVQFHKLSSSYCENSRTGVGSCTIVPKEHIKPLCYRLGSCWETTDNGIQRGSNSAQTFLQSQHIPAAPHKLTELDKMCHQASETAQEQPEERDKDLKDTGHVHMYVSIFFQLTVGFFLHSCFFFRSLHLLCAVFLYMTFSQKAAADKRQTKIELV